jgi:hypothetical protein
MGLCVGDMMDYQTKYGLAWLIAYAIAFGLLSYMLKRMTQRNVREGQNEKT